MKVQVTVIKGRNLNSSYYVKPEEAEILASEGTHIISSTHDHDPEECFECQEEKSLEEYTITELKGMLRDLALPVSGSKSELIARLEGSE